MIAVNWYPNGRELRQFAVVLPFGFALVGFMVLRLTGSASAATTLGVIGAAAFLVGVVLPHAIRPVYLILITLSLPIGWLVSQVVLRFMFYCVLTPLGLFFRLVRQDALALRRPSSARTYWRQRVQHTKVSAYFRQS